MKSHTDTYSYINMMNIQFDRPDIAFGGDLLKHGK